MLSQKWVLTSWIVGMCACGTAPVSEAPTPTPSDSSGYVIPQSVTAGVTKQSDDVPDDGTTYRQMGFVASGPPISFVGAAAAFATPTPDTTLVVVALSIPNRGLTFSREGTSYEAIYDVSLRLTRSGTTLREIDDADTVRVASPQETGRTDESILYRRLLRLAPGEYTLTYTVQDGTAGREATQTTALLVPSISPTSISRPVVVYGGTPRNLLKQSPQYLPKPRSALVFGIDKTVNVYLEAYSTTLTTPVLCALRDARDSIIWHDTVWLAKRKELSSGILTVPVGRADIGRLMLSAVRPGTTDTLWTPLFMSFGPGFPEISFSEMVSDLRFFATTDWLHRLHTAPPTSRSSVWASFLIAIDSSTKTTHEGLHDYFERIRQANELFKDDHGQSGHGWLSDRGSVFVGLGEPDEAYERDAYDRNVTPFPSPKLGGRAHFLVWEYHALQARIIFSDDMELGQWRLVPSSVSLFQRLLTLKLAG